MCIGMTSTVRSKSKFGAYTSLFGPNLSLGSNSVQTFMGVFSSWLCGQEGVPRDQVKLRVSQSK